MSRPPTLDDVDGIVGGWPYWATYAFFVVVALLRSNATY